MAQPLEAKSQPAGVLQPLTMRLSTRFDCEVFGLPIPQGSMCRAGLSLRYSNHKELIDWRHNVMKELISSKPDDWDSDAAVELTATFIFPRPAGHWGKGKNQGKLNGSAPWFKLTRPDLDKCLRAVGDSMEQAGIVKNDAQIVALAADKRFATYGEEPGLMLTIYALD